uniref:Carbonic anhydrase 14 n=1 Tax=Cyanoderma ruficeps TaxID=181631 RepID=A0A8C3NQ71_9PASS
WVQPPIFPLLPPPCPPRSNGPFVLLYIRFLLPNPIRIRPWPNPAKPHPVGPRGPMGAPPALQTQLCPRSPGRKKCPQQINEALGNVTRGGVPSGLWVPPGPHGQQHWHEGHPECAGRAQSPIDIETARAQPDPSLPPLQPEGYEHPESPELTLANNGHTAVLALPPSLRLRGLPHTFAAVQLHFHWGRPGRAAGAEHLLDGHRAPAEMHVVHFDAERFADASVAQQHPGGLAVLGVLLEREGETPNPLPSTPQLIQDLLPTQLDRYYRYNGSLTTPPCFQSVLWTLFPQPVHISQAQVGPALGEPPPPDLLLVDNFRAPQELNQRLVLSSFPRGEQRGGKGPLRPSCGSWSPSWAKGAGPDSGLSLAEPEGYSTGRAGKAGLGGQPWTPLTSPASHR